MTAEELNEILKAVNANRPHVTQTMNFNAPIGQQIAHVDRIEAHFDKDMGMQVVNDMGKDAENGQNTCALDMSNIFNNPQGINDDGDMWLLLVAAKARRKSFKHLPDFVDWAFETFDVPFDKEDCKNKLQARMRNQGWDTIRNQETMISFIKDFRHRESERISDTHRANTLYVAIQGI